MRQVKKVMAGSAVVSILAAWGMGVYQITQPGTSLVPNLLSLFAK